jgi:N-acetylglutamate synthase-like GNAT family acetyltransferase
MIKETLEKINTKTPFDKELKVDFLKNHPELIPILVDWVYNEWINFDKTLEKERLVTSFKNRLNDDKLPFSLVAVKDGKPAGVISLKAEEDPELNGLSKGSPWLGTLCIDKSQRHSGIASGLLEGMKSIAKELGHKDLFLYMSCPHTVIWYTRKGAQEIDKRTFHDHPVSILKIDLK